MLVTRTCTVCTAVKAISLFRKCGKYYRHKCLDCFNIYQAEWARTPTGKASREKYEARPKRIEQKKLYQKQSKFKVYKNLWKKNKYYTNPSYRTMCICRSSIISMLNGFLEGKRVRTRKIVGLCGAKLILYLNSKASKLRMRIRVKSRKSQYSAGNFFQVDIDHIIPIIAFDHTNPDHVRVCHHFTNLQLLSHSENCRKGCSLPANFDLEEHVKEMLINIEIIENDKLTWSDVLEAQEKREIFGFVRRNKNSMWWKK